MTQKGYTLSELSEMSKEELRALAIIPYSSIDAHKYTPSPDGTRLRNTRLVFDFKLSDILEKKMPAKEREITCWVPDVKAGRFVITKVVTYPEDLPLYRDDNYRGIIHCFLSLREEPILIRRCFSDFEVPFQCRGDLRPIPTDDWLLWAYGGGTKEENAILIAAGLPPVVKPEPPKTGADRLLSD